MPPRPSHESGSRQLVAVVGPTGAGKTELAIALALRFGGEVVNADSRQVYTGMDIGTAKPTRSQREQVPHHLFDLIYPDEDYSLALYLRDARSAIRSVHERSALPIVVGGTGQYVWGLLDGWQVPDTPPSPGIRRELERRAENEGLAVLVSELERLDPDAAERIDPLNPRRVIRALEVAMQLPTRPDEGRKLPPEYGITILGLSVEREQLYQRLDGRTETMIAAGWVDEAQALIDAGYGIDLPSMSSIGYRELALHLSGDLSLDEAVAEIKRRNRRLVRHQRNWFKPTDPRIEWFESTPKDWAPATLAVADALNRQ